MGRFICMGIAFRYVIEKRHLYESLKENIFKFNIDEDNVIKELKKNFSEDIYGFEEDEDYYSFFLKPEIEASDFINLYDEFVKVAYKDIDTQNDTSKIRADLLTKKSMEEIYEYAKDNRCNFWSFDYPFYLFGAVLSMFDKIIYINTSVEGISLYMDDFKTICEFEGWSFDLFSDLLKYRLKHTKLGEGMFVFLSA